MLSRATTTPWAGRRVASREHGDGIGDVLQHLVRVYDVERRVGMLERVDVTDCELHVVYIARRAVSPRPR